MDKQSGKCAACPFKPNERVCNSLKGKAPSFCSTELYPEEIANAGREFEKDQELRRFAYNSALQEAACYEQSPFNPAQRQPVKPRILEVIEFCKRQGYRKLGLAFCIGLRKEAAMLSRILESHGFDVVSTVCKVGCVDKSFVGLSEDEKIFGGHESMCNPIAQAMILNSAKTEFNLMLGLCVGHDSMFFKYAEAPTTVIAVKDRLLGHNPLAALYSGYYKFLEKPAEK